MSSTGFFDEDGSTFTQAIAGDDWCGPTGPQLRVRQDSRKISEKLLKKAMLYRIGAMGFAY